MLQQLNERIQGVVAWIIVILVTVTFTLLGISYYLQSRHESEVKAKIDGQSISKQDFDLNYRRLSHMQNPETLTAANESRFKQQVLSEMIANTVKTASARSLGFDVNAQQAVSAIMKIPQFQEDGHFSNIRYTQTLSNAFFTPQTFQQEVRQGMLLNQQRFALIGSAFVLPNELNQFIKLSLQTRDYKYTLVKAADFLGKVSVSQDDVQHYYDQHHAQFMSKEKISIDYIRLSMSEIKKTLHIQPEQIQHYYEDNKTNYLNPARWQLSYILFPLHDENIDADTETKQTATKVYDELLTSPDHFEIIAKDAVLSQHAEQGVWPDVVAGQSNLDSYLMNLTEPGQLTPPIKQKEGYVIFQVKSYQPAMVQSLAEVKPLIADQLIQEAAQKKYSEKEDLLSELTYQNPDSLTPVAKALHIQMHHSPLFYLDEPTKDPLLQNKAVTQAAFSHDVLVFGNNSEPIQIDSDELIVLRVNKHIPAALQALKDVEANIKETLLQQKARMAAQDFGKNLAADATKSITSNLNWTLVNQAARDSSSISAEINELAFAMNPAVAYEGKQLSNGDFALVKLLQINDGHIDETDKEQNMNITQQLESNFGLMDYDLYFAQLMSQAKIEKF